MIKTFRNFTFYIAILIFVFYILNFNSYSLDELGEELKLYLGEPEIISVNNPSRIVIGNPNVVDVAEVTKHEITLNPKAVGTTTFVFWDNFGEQSYKIKVFAEDINEIKRRVDNLLSKLNLPEVHSQAEEDEGKVLLLGRVKNSQERERISVALGALKEKTVDLIEVKEEEAIVEIDVQVLELNKDATRTLGLTWPGSVTLTEKGSAGISDAGVKSSQFSELFRVLNLNRAAFSWTLDALVQEGKARVLSRPRLACQSGKEAELLVGGEKPVFTTEVASAGGEGTNVEYKEYGIKLKMKPTITDRERIKVVLNVEVSEVGTAETIGLTTAPTAKAYPLSKRTASTELFLNDGQTMAIGGLIKQKSEEDLRKVPWLADVPVLGLFFRKSTTRLGGGQGERGDTELFIALTPTIVSQREPQAKKEPSPEAVSAGPIEGDIPGPVATYALMLQNRILENLAYPASAREAGFQGTVKLSLRLSFSGELLEARVKTSSGYNILDDNALTIVKRISTYPPFPASIKEKELWVDIPILYRLD